MKNNLTFVVLGAVLVAAIGFCALGTHAQQTPGGAWNSYQMMCDIEGLWAQVTFTLGLSDAKLLEMRQSFQKAWDARNKITAGITSGKDVLPSIDRLNALGSELLSQVKKDLTEEQFTKLSPWIEMQNARLQMARSAIAGWRSRRENKQ
jgi:hypothetical protein